MPRIVFWKAVATLVAASVLLGADWFERPPVEYTVSTPNNRLSKLEAEIGSQAIALRHEAKFGYLRDLLEELEIAEDSQMLVFSKTSLQRERISPRTPRALYFNDDSYVGYCQGGEVIEIAVTDSQLGAVFYTLDQSDAASPKFTRQTHRCLQCHSSPATGEMPGYLVRSLFVGRSGMPLLSEGSHRVDHRTPIEDRWGGWYVSGTHGDQKHLGNLVVRDPNAPRPWTNDEGQNVTDLTDRFSTRKYLTPHSDIVALMVFEHQTHVHNLISQANYAARQALHDEKGLNEALGESPSNRLGSTTRRIEGAGERLLEGLLMVDEAPLTGPLVGVSSFAAEFTSRGPRDDKGRSLRDLDLKGRLFKYPCSYLIYSEAFDNLPAEMTAYLQSRMAEILVGRGGEKFAHLTPHDREAIAAILAATKPGWLSIPIESEGTSTTPSS